MAVVNNTTDGILYGLAADTPTTEFGQSSKFYEMDTGTLYIYDGTVWRDPSGVAR